MMSDDKDSKNPSEIPAADQNEMTGWKQPPADAPTAQNPTAPPPPDPIDPSAAANDDAAPPDNPGAAGAGELDKLLAENTALKDSLLRNLADMENLRRRTAREKTETAKYAISNFARDVLGIADNLARAVAAVPGEAIEQDPALKSLIDGVQMTDRELLNVMERHGVRRINPQGERFDPNLHQAMYKLPNPDIVENTVVQVAQVGYMIEDRVLRPAMVGVSEGGPKAAKAAPADPGADTETKTKAPQQSREQPQAPQSEAPSQAATPAADQRRSIDESSNAPPAKTDSPLGTKIDKSA